MLCPGARESHCTKRGGPFPPLALPLHTKEAEAKEPTGDTTVSGSPFATGSAKKIGPTPEQARARDKPETHRQAKAQEPTGDPTVSGIPFTTGSAKRIVATPDQARAKDKPKAHRQAG